MSVIEQWAHGGLEVVDLPSGLRIRGKLPTVQDLVLLELGPNELLAKALPLLGKPVATYNPEEQRTWIAYQRILAAAYVREAWNPETSAWEPARITPETLANGAPPDDVDALEDLVLRRRTAGQVSAQSRFNRGDLTLEELRGELAKEAGGTVNAWSAFRGERAGDAPVESGEAVGDAPERPSGNRRSRRGARARSGARGSSAR